MSESRTPGWMLPAHALTPGRLVDIWDQGAFCYHAQVEEHVPRLGVAWVREAGLGHRRLVLAQQCRHPAVTDPAVENRTA
ncbi:hypothetical protein ACT4S5_01795 [Kocuria oceani]|uniref:hypothetical protein n=1 Tax=Kocuria oceani TaxID=988827 RepID=UPI004036A4A0